MVPHCQRNRRSGRRIALLGRLVEVESEKDNVADSYMRLANLYRESDPAASAENALKAWKLVPTSTDFAEFAAYCLVEIQDYEKAVRVLDDCRKLIDGSSDHIKKINLELAIARIWHTFLKRKDLAKLRIEHALHILRKIWTISNDVKLSVWSLKKSYRRYQTKIFHQSIRLGNKPSLSGS